MAEETSMPPVPVPEQVKGGKTDTDYSITAADELEAHELFLASRERLLNVNKWHEIAGILSGEFKLTDARGNETKKHPNIGDYIKIDIPGPGTAAGHGYDWVQIEAIDDKSNDSSSIESILMRVRPAQSPVDKKSDIAHFFDENASSSFTLDRQEKTVTAGVHGRNEVPNTDADSLLDKARNSAVGVAAIIGFNAPQWKGLVKGIMGK